MNRPVAVNEDHDVDASFVVVVHYADDAPLTRTLAHAFGPYETVAAALADNDTMTDGCFKVVIDLFVPPSVMDRAVEVADEYVNERLS